eukprot:6206391-Pleurochrysis_carterae.AAC.1
MTSVTAGTSTPLASTLVVMRKRERPARKSLSTCEMHASTQLVDPERRRISMREMEMQKTPTRPAPAPLVVDNSRMRHATRREALT